MQAKYYPDYEKLTYKLVAKGLKGSVESTFQKTNEGAKLKAHLLAALAFPNKKLVDSSLTADWEMVNGVFKIKNYSDRDFKSDQSRIIEVRNSQAIIKYQKFENEESQWQLNEELKYFDPLSIGYSIREFVIEKKKRDTVHLLTRQGAQAIEVEMSDTKSEASKEFVKIKVKAENMSGRSSVQVDNLEIWADASNGQLTEISYALPVYGKLSLQLDIAETN